jgi:uncharacterized membrane protein YGL010W
LTAAKHALLGAAAFALALVSTCVANFVLQLGLIFVDVLTRLEESAAMVLASWFVTGVFTTVFAIGWHEQFVGKEHFRWRTSGNVALLISALVLAVTIVLICRGWSWRDPQDWSLLTENPWNVVACFTGSGGMAAVGRTLDSPPAKS